ncbi:dnaJ homolog subfamily C member 24 isoform 1-T5 [Aulostomus maculatus]
MCEAADKDLYAVLGASPSDSVQQLRHRYQKLALQYHPDRWGDTSPSEAESGMKRFLEVDAAWRILSDQSSRSQYDQHRRAGELKQDWPVDSTVSLEDMSWNPEVGVYTYFCRCGGEFIISGDDVQAETWGVCAEEEDTKEGQHVVVCCNTCSLSVVITLSSHTKTHN